MTKSELIEAAYKALPYSEQIESLDIDTEAEAISFVWRGNRLRVDFGMNVATREDGMLRSCDLSLLVSSLMKRAWLACAERKAKP